VVFGTKYNKIGRIKQMNGGEKPKKYFLMLFE